MSYFYEYIFNRSRSSSILFQYFKYLKLFLNILIDVKWNSANGITLLKRETDLNKLDVRQVVKNE